MVVFVSKIRNSEIHHTSANEPLQNESETNKLLEQTNLNQKNVKVIIDDSNIQKEEENIVKVDDPLPQKVTKEKKVQAEPKIEKIKKPKVAIEKDTKQTIKSLVNVKDIKICKNIKNRNPVGVSEVFSNTVDSLYCFTKIENLGKKIEVRHIWFYENQMMTQVRYNVKKSNVYRSWTKKTISSYQIGNWRVEVQDRNGTIIGSKQFTIKKSS
tara:strand:- start:276 stop:911 length:636 start_codon:yes stop_codon:yes gene_type:complete